MKGRVKVWVRFENAEKTIADDRGGTEAWFRTDEIGCGESVPMVGASVRPDYPCLDWLDRWFNDNTGTVIRIEEES